MRHAWRAAAALVATAYLAAMTVLGWTAWATADLPSTARLAERTRPASVRYLDRYNRELLVRGAKAAGDVRAPDLPAHLIRAVLAVEDQRFARHVGVDAEGIARALVSNLRTGRRAQGGSTLTQQLVKNVFLSSEKTYRRKAQEAVLALWLEREYTKDEILEMYLERVYFGAGTWGVRAASQTYFGVEPEGLSLAQSALLAGLLKAPSNYSPTADPEAAGRRAHLVLARMEALRFITREERRAALAEPLAVRAPGHARGGNYFADWIAPEVARLGASARAMEGGSLPDEDIVVRTTLDADVQAAAEAAVAVHLDPARGASEAAVVVLDAQGGVRAMVGGADYARSSFNRAVQAERQPGSSFKPVVYLAASEAGLRPWDHRLDAPVEIDGWAPRNFDGSFRGEVAVEDAFAQSLNTVAVRVQEEVGRERVAAAAARLGLEGMRPLRSLALGAQGSSPLAMTRAYLPFANRGRTARPHGILSVETGGGEELWRTPGGDGADAVVANRPLRDINRMLVATVERGTGRRARVPGRTVGGKTGTTNAHRDAWFVGIAPGYAVGVWVGNDANVPMDRVTGGSIPAAIFGDVMGAMLAEAGPGVLPVSEPPIYADPEAVALERLLSRVEDALP